MGETRIRDSHMAKSNSIKLRRNTTIGNVSAEADEEFLIPCFVDSYAVTEVKSFETNKMFVTGRTGSGKTAVLLKIQNSEENVVVIELSELAMNYIANSDIIKFLSSLDIDLDLFYQTLWKHVFCIEYIRVKYNIKNSQDSWGFMEGVKSLFEFDERKKRAIKYLQEWENKFWITMDENIKELTTKFESELRAELGIEIDKFLARAGYQNQIGREKKSQIIQRAKKVVNSEQLSDLAKVMDLLSEQERKNRYSNKYYILIDKLDEKWVDEEVRYDLIKALIESLRSIRKVRDLKVAVSIREDVLERIIQTNNDSGFQTEKYNDYFLSISWTKNELYELVNKRINFLFRKKYSSENVFFDDLFEEKVGAENSFNYMIDRTLMRPRDIIEFVNECIKQSIEESFVDQRAIKRAEREYSRNRLKALQDEWQHTFPSLPFIFNTISSRGADFKPNQDFWDHDFLEDLAVSINVPKNSIIDPVIAAKDNWSKTVSESDKNRFSQEVLSLLYRIGAISLKMNPNDPYWHCTKDAGVVEPSSITVETKSQIHKMLRHALNVARDDTRKKARKMES